VLADICLVPVGASAAEIWATGDILALIEEASKVKRVNARMVWTRYRPNTKLAQNLTELATKELGLKAIGTSLGMRVSYMEALGSGLTAAELADQSAKDEVKSLVNEVKQLLKVKP
jgi:chromosome partitioning protein